MPQDNNDKVFHFTKPAVELYNKSFLNPNLTLVCLDILLGLIQHTVASLIFTFKSVYITICSGQAWNNLTYITQALWLFLIVAVREVAWVVVETAPSVTLCGKYCTMVVQKVCKLVTNNSLTPAACLAQQLTSSFQVEDAVKVRGTARNGTV